ncbi:MAG: hypothetical protein V1889_03495 [archaeon]
MGKLKIFPWGYEKLCFSRGYGFAMEIDASRRVIALRAGEWRKDEVEI